MKSALFVATTRTLLVLVLATLLFSADAQTGAANDEPALKDQKARSSYALGMQMGGKLKGPALDLDAALVAQGLKDAMVGGTLLTEAQMNASLKTLQAGFLAQQAEALKHAAEKNKKEGEAFLADNKTKEGIVSRESGLQYKVLKSGDGKKPSADDVVVCHYRGALIDGTEFDSSYKRNQPATFALNSLIPGWSEALQLMPVGSKWQIFIPSSLAYGQTGQRTRKGGATLIGPNAALIFDVELLSIADSAGAGPQTGAKGSEGVTALRFSFKLDPRITKASYMGERWVSPPSYTTTLDTVEARVTGIDRRGQPANVNAKWVPSDPEMVTVLPGDGHEVKIAVRRAGETTLRVSAGDISRELTLKAAYRGNGMQVEVAQK